MIVLSMKPATTRSVRRMILDKSYPPWPGTDDNIVVQEMLRDHSSGQWHECREYVRKLVHVKAKNIPEDYREDIIQDAMMRIAKSLATFQLQCAFKTWIFGIVHSCIIDAYRKSRRVGQFTTPLNDIDVEGEHESNMLTMHATISVEDKCILDEQLLRVWEALQEYVSTHANPTRNSRILNMVLFENRTLEETARAVGCSAPVVGYIVRSARRYVREKFGHQP
jgi:RNA polymerase sigma factor (sigma-70 family)